MAIFYTDSASISDIIATGSFTGSFTGNGSGLTGIVASATPGGADTNIQFNDGGVFSGSSNFTFNKTTNQVQLSGSLLISGSTPNIITGSLNINNNLGLALQLKGSGSTIFSISGSSGEIFKISDDSATTTLFNISSASVSILDIDSSKNVNISGSLIINGPVTGSSFTGSFVGNGSGLTGIVTLPGGADTNIQFNDGGVFSGSADFTFNKTTDLLLLTGSLLISGSTPNQITGSLDISGSVNADNTEQFIRITNDFVINAGAANALQNVTGLSFSYGNGDEYYFLFHGIFTTDASTTGTRWTLSGTNFAQLAYNSEYALTATTTTRNAMLSAQQLPAASNATSNVSNGGGNLTRIEGMLVANGAGTLQIQGAREVTTGTVTLKAGSYLKYKKMI